MKEKILHGRRKGFQFYALVVALCMTVLGLVLSFLSYTTGYYALGDKNSILVVILAAMALLMGLASLWLGLRYADNDWPGIIPILFAVFLILAAVFHIGDRFEGIGVCIVTDYDAGHGGEEAIYLSIAATVLWLAAAVLVLIGNFKQMLKPQEEAAV